MFTFLKCKQNAKECKLTHLIKIWHLDILLFNYKRNFGVSVVINLQNYTKKGYDYLLTITLDFVKGTLLIRLEGILTKKTSTELIQTIDVMVYEKGIRYIIINLEEIKHLDNHTISNLLKRYNKYFNQDQNRKLIICGYNILKSLTVKRFVKNNYLISNNELTALKLINI